ncbi:ROK family protein [Nocardia sp. 348MFTsu5.1]|uniref:ROK family protein n=1 Tax=Nocardia sp. 348MFTsu5.1 TaxID=1172185 RepID=UPI0012DE810C|nr:ROK family protein [Nocardia sp. 348MFTsu5.1]
MRSDEAGGGARPAIRVRESRTVSFERGDGAAAVVFRAVRTQGPVTRDRLPAATGLSPATVNRQLQALDRLGLVRERPDLVAGGAIGRPKIPLTLDRDRFCVIAVHIGALSTLLMVADLGGRPLQTVAMSTPVGPAPEALGLIARRAALVADSFTQRVPLWAGAAVGGTVHEDGSVDHAQLGWRRAPVGAALEDELGLPVSVSPHVQAMAAAELLLAGAGNTTGTDLLFYVRETVGLATTIDGRVQERPGNIGHIPVHAPLLTGRPQSILQDVVGRKAFDDAVAAGRDAGDLHDERARVLGEMVALVRDLINPDRVVLAGHVFAEHRHGLAPVQAAFDAASGLPPLELSPPRFGARVQEGAAVVVSLGALYADPIGALQNFSA